MTEIVACNKDNQPQINYKTNKYDTDHKVECKKIKFDEVNDQPTDLTNSDIQMGKKIKEQDNLSMKLEENIKSNIDQQLKENIKEEIDQQLENDQESTPKVGEPIKIDKHTLNYKIQSNEQLTGKNNQSDDGKIVDNSGEKIISNESFANTVGQYTDINEQPSIDVVEQNKCMLDTSLSNVVDQSIITDNQILANKCTTIDIEEPVDNLAEENEPEQLSEHTENVQNTDNLKTNAAYSNNDNSIRNAIASSSKAYDQTSTDNVDQCSTTIKQVVGNQNNNTSKKTSHNISNIINTDVIVINDSVETNKQIVNSGDIEIKQLEHFQITNEKNISQEKKISVSNIDCPKDFSNKHSLNKILQKSDDIKEMSVCPNSKSFNVDLEVDQIGLVKSEVEINVEESNLKSKDILKDLTVIKEDKLTENENNISLINSSVLEDQKEIVDAINKVAKSDKDHELSTIAMDHCKKDEIKQENVNVNHAEIKQNKAKKEKHKLFNVVHDTDSDVCNEEKLNLKEFKSVPCNKDNLVQDLSVQESKLEMESLKEIGEDSAVDIFHSGKIKRKLYTIYNFNKIKVI